MNINYITPWYAELSFESLKDFLKWKIDQAIVPFENFVFRGLSKSSYKLIPSALRRNEKTNTYPILNYHPSGCGARMAALTIGNFVESEYSALCKFFKECNRQGLYVPSIRKISSNYLKRYNKYFDKLSTWYDDDMLELAALAQHYEVPTRMLDWTFNFNVALYFALKGVVEDLYNKRDIETTYTIWGVNAENILANYEYYDDKLRCPIKFFVPNYIGNERIKLQKGLLTYKEIADYQTARFTHYLEEPFDKVLLDYLEALHNKYIQIASDGIQLFKITIPTKMAVEEFDMLSKKGYNAASVFSGYDGVLKKLKEDDWIRTLPLIN